MTAVKNSFYICDKVWKDIVPQPYVSRIETCERRIDILELMNICEALDISLIDFVREIDEDILPKFKASQKRQE